MTECFDPIRGSTIRVTGLSDRGRLLDPAPYAVSRSVATVQVREVTTTVSTELMKTPTGEKRLRVGSSTQTIRQLVDVNFLRCDPRLLSLMTQVGLSAQPHGGGFGFGDGGFGLGGFGGEGSQTEGFGGVEFGEAPFGGDPDFPVNGFDVSSHARPVSFALEVWTKLAGARCADGSRRWGYTVFPYLRGGRISGVRFANGLVSFNLIGAQTRRGRGWGVGPHDLEGTFERMTSAVSRNTGWRMYVAPAQPPEQTDGILYRSDVLDNGTAANPMPDPDAPAVVDGGGATTSAWIIDGGRA